MARTTVPLNMPTDQPTRRGLLVGIAAAGMLGGAAPAMAARDVDPHIEWWRRSRELEVRANADDLDEAASGAIAAEGYALEELIAATPARTMDGVMCQLRLVHFYTGIGQPASGCDEIAMANAIATLERLADGRAAA